MDSSLYIGIGVSYGGTVSGGSGLGFATLVSSQGNCGGGSWQCETVNTNSLPSSTSFQMAQCGLLICSSPTQIAYYDQNYGAIFYAVRVENGQGNCIGNQNWDCWVIDLGVGTPSGPISPGLALVVDTNGQPVILYQDFSEPLYANSVVKAAWPEANGNCGPNQNWRCVIIDSGYRSGTFANVGAALDAELVDGRIYAAYYDEGNGDLVLSYEPAPAATVTPTPTISLTNVPDPTPTTTPVPSTLNSVFLPLVRR